jgi:hypothetical protein
MIAGRKRSLIMLVLLGVSIFIYHVGLGIFHASGRKPLPSFEFLYLAMFLCGVVWWLRAETRDSPVTQLYCTGLFAITAWPIIIAYHLLKTRGVKGLIPLFALIATFVFSKVLGAVIFLSFSGLYS